MQRIFLIPALFYRNF